MLGPYPVHPTIPAADLDRARKFYEETLGLTVEREAPDGIFYRAGDTSFLLYPSQFAGTAQNTMMSFVVDDLAAVAARLRERGVEFEEYDFPGLKTENGIAETPEGRAAWFKDTEGNILAISDIAVTRG